MFSMLHKKFQWFWSSVIGYQNLASILMYSFVLLKLKNFFLRFVKKDENARNCAKNNHCSSLDGTFLCEAGTCWNITEAFR